MVDQVRIPSSSSRRRQPAYAKLLARVDPAAENGFGFEGSFIRPGKLVPLEALWPTPGHPPAPLLLEYAGAIDPHRGHRRPGDEDLYVLWRFDVEGRAWIEMARTTARTWEWTLVLRPLAVRLLAESDEPRLAVVPALGYVVCRVGRLLDRISAHLPEAERAQFLSALHDELAVRMCRAA